MHRHNACPLFMHFNRQGGLRLRSAAPHFAQDDKIELELGMTRVNTAND